MSAEHLPVTEGAVGRALAIVPAAGRSRRMGRAKLLLPYGDDTIIGTLVTNLEDAGVRPVLLVLRPGASELRRWARSRSLPVSNNPEPERGMLSSIHAGIRALGGAARLAQLLTQSRAPLLVTPADFPALRATTVTDLLDHQARSERGLVLPTCGGRRGHPLLIHPRLLAAVDALDPAVGLHAILERHEHEIETVETDDTGVLRDVDTAEDYRRLEP